MRQAPTPTGDDRRAGGEGGRGEEDGGNCKVWNHRLSVNQNIQATGNAGRRERGGGRVAVPTVGACGCQLFLGQSLMIDREFEAGLPMIVLFLSFSRSFFKALADGPTCKYRHPRPCRSS